MSYSTHQDLLNVYSDLDAYLVSISTPVFTGAALNDLSVSGVFTGSADKSFIVKIDAAGSPDTFTWSNDGGTSWQASGVAITGSLQLLSDGISITFGATSGHTASDQWTFDCSAAGSDTERGFAYDWVNDSLRSMYSVPFSSPSQTVVLCEAFYAVYLILLANDVANAASFLSAAQSLIGSLAVSQLADQSNKSSPISSTSGIQREFSRGSYGSDGKLLGRGTSGDGRGGSLDNW